MHRLLKVKDMDAVSFGEDKFAHLGVPAPGLMPEVNAGLKKLAHACNCHA
jgi:hypothetical protein